MQCNGQSLSYSEPCINPLSHHSGTAHSLTHAARHPHLSNCQCPQQYSASCNDNIVTSKLASGRVTLAQISDLHLGIMLGDGMLDRVIARRHTADLCRAHRGSF